MGGKRERREDNKEKTGERREKGRERREDMEGREERGVGPTNHMDVASTFTWLQHLTMILV